MTDRLPLWAIFLTPAEREELRAIRARLRAHDEAMARLAERVRESMGRMTNEEDHHGPDDGDHRA